MDNLTHGLLGLAVGALRRRPPPSSAAPSPAGGRLDVRDKAALLTGVLAAELPDLDTLLARGDAVTVALHAHRGLSHALLFTPVIALAASLLAKALFRRAPLLPLFRVGLLSVLLAHLLPDVWTGWGTRLLLPFSDARLALDWTVVVDPWVTLPLLGATLWAWRRRDAWRAALLTGLALSGLYVGGRVASQAVLTARVQQALPEAERVHVFPAPLSVATWRYVARLPQGALSAGEVPLWGAPREQRRLEGSGGEVLPEAVRQVPTVREALAWARFPHVTTRPTPEGREVRIADLRYHLAGSPTLTFVLHLDAAHAVRTAHLERGGSAGELFRRWRQGPSAARAP